MKTSDPSNRGGLPSLHTRAATPDEMATVLRASHTVWGEGMSPDAYLAYNRTMKESRWGRERYRFILGIAAGDAIVAALELYSLEGELHGRSVRIAGVGALFTLPEHRGRGFAAALVETVLGRARRDRFGLALLLSDIDGAYYTRLGFSALPAGEASCVTALPAPWPGEPAWVSEADPLRGVPGLRFCGPAEVEALGRLHEADESAAVLRLTRDRRSWEQLFLKTDAGRRLRGEGETVFWIIDDHAGPAAYAVVRDRPGALRWLEHGARPGGERRLDDLFWAAIARARRRGLARLEGWSLPSGAAGKTLYPIARRARRRPLPMVRLLEPGLTLSGLRNETDCRIGALDRF
jgi:GNAT superfamily N-acetyltransferase